MWPASIARRIFKQAVNSTHPRGRAGRHRREAPRRGTPDVRRWRALFDAPDLLAVGWLANREREKRHGARTYFNYNLRLEPTNVCEASCLFCSFARLQPGMPRRIHDVARAGLGQASAARAISRSPKLHIVNGLNPDLPFSYYTELLRGFKRDPARHSSEVLHRRRDRVLRRSLRHDRRAGAARAEGRRARFTARRRRGDFRRARAPRRSATTSATPIGISRSIASRIGLGLRTNVTMLYGHIETMEERVDHMMRARALQDETGGFQAFIPLAFHPDNNQMRKLPAPTRHRHAARARGGAADVRQHSAHQGVLDRDRASSWRRRRCGLASTTWTAPCRKRRFTTWPDRPRPRG